MKKLIILLFTLVSVAISKAEVSVGFTNGLKTDTHANVTSIFILTDYIYTGVSASSCHENINVEINYEVGPKIKINEKYSLVPIVGLSTALTNESQYILNKPIYGASVGIHFKHVTLLPKVTNYSFELGVSLNL